MIKMAFVEMGTVSSSLVRMVFGRFMTRKTEPLFTRETHRQVAQGPRDTSPIRTAPLNSAEAAEQQDLRSIRDALLAAQRD